jgi:hypothetical protein
MGGVCMAKKRFEWADHECSRWCKVHYYWHFEHDMHRPYPEIRNILISTQGWHHVTVFVGPPAYYPKRRTPEQLQAMQMTCPHDPAQLTCQTCHRHDFYPRVIA